MSNKQNENSWLHPKNAPVPEGPLQPIDFAGEKKTDRIFGWGFLILGIALLALFVNFIESEIEALTFLALLFGLAGLFCSWIGFYALYRVRKARKAMKNIKPEPGDYAAFEAERAEGLLQIAGLFGGLFVTLLISIPGAVNVIYAHKYAVRKVYMKDFMTKSMKEPAV